MNQKGTLTFFCGKMGAGKTTKSKTVSLEKNAVLLSEDDWLEAHYPNQINSVDSSGEVIGKGDIGRQAKQIFRNLEIALSAVGAKIDNVIKWNVYVVQGQSPQPGFEEFQRVWGNRPNPPLITVLFVAGLANPDFLMEINAIAVIPENIG